MEAAAAFALFVPQLIFVPLMQGAINRRAGARVWILRHLGVGVQQRPRTGRLNEENGLWERI